MTKHFEQTKFGFEWGPMSIVRHISHEGMVVLGFKTARCNFDIYVTPTGMVRIVVPQGESVTVIGGRKRREDG